MKRCPQCHREYADEASTCEDDGARLVPLERADDALLGEELKGEYRIEQRIGSGGMANVYRATQLHLDRNVAVKVMSPKIHASREMRRRFDREAHLLSMLSHPNVVSIIDFGTSEDDLLYMVMEYLSGETLEAYVPRDRGLPLAEIVELMGQLCAGVAALHQIPLVHRDLKPSNLLLTNLIGGGRLLKILDLGISKHLMQEDTIETQAGVLIGTPGYMAPEQIGGAGGPDPRSDIYSLGAVLYFLICGHRPFPGDTSQSVLMKQLVEPPPPLDPSTLAESEAACLSSVAFKAMAMTPDQRYQSAEEMLAAIRALANAGSQSSVTSLAEAPTQITDPATAATLASAATEVETPPPPVASKSGGIGKWLWAIPLILLITLGPFSLNKGWIPGFEKAPGVPGVSDERILFGMSGAFSGPSSMLGRQMRVGIETYFQSVNALGGIHGRKLELVALDDGYEPERALANTKELIHGRKVFAIIGNTGTPTAKVVIPYINAHKKLLFGAFTGAGLLRKDPPDRYVINYRASYAQETAAMIHYFLRVRRIKPDQIAVFSQNDSYGDAGFKGVTRTLRDLGHAPDKLLHVRHQRNQVDAKDAVQQVLKHKGRIKAIVMISTYRVAARFIQSVRDGGMSPVFANVSFVGARPLAQELKELGGDYAEGVIVTQVVPYYAAQAGGVLRYMSDLQDTHPQEQPSFVSLEGYIVANLLVEALRELPQPTTELLIKRLESIKDLDLGIGAILSLGPSDHQASDKVWGTVLDRYGRFRPLELR